MKNLIIMTLLVVSGLSLTGCGAGIVEDVTEGKVRVDEDWHKTNRPNGTTLDDMVDAAVAKSEVKDMEAADNQSLNTESTDQNNQGTEVVTTEADNETSLISKKTGWLRGTVGNVSEKSIDTKIYRKTAGKWKKFYSQGFGQMSLKHPYLPAGCYKGVVTVDGRELCHEFEVRKDEKNNFEVLVYNKITKTEELVNYEGFFYLVYKEVNKLTVKN